MNQLVNLNDEKSQMHAALCMGLIFIFVGIPIWWKTTEVYRADLPYSAIQQLANYALLTTKIDILLLSASETEAQVLQDSLSKAVSKDNFKYVAIEYKFERTVLPLEQISSVLQESRNIEPTETTSMNKGNQLQIVFTISNSIEKARIFLTKKRTILLEISESQFKNEIESIASAVMELIENNIVNTPSLEDAMSKAYGVNREFSKEREEHMMKTVQPSNGYDIVFSLICPEPDKIQVSWDIENAVDMFLKPFVTKLEGFANFNLGSQILYYSGLSIRPKVEKLKDGSKNFYLTHEQLSHVVNPIESRLGTQVSQNPALNFVIYVTEEKYIPQFIQKKDGTLSKTNTFLVPRWGAIKIQNFPKTGNVSDLPRLERIDSKGMMSVFVAQLRSLLGVEAIPQVHQMLQIELARTDTTSLRDFELDYLIRAKTVENIAISIHTLDSLSQLLGKIRNIVINDNIANEIYSAVDSIRTAITYLENGNLKKALEYSNLAFVSSETAFFNPTLLELLYFPEDQKFAIYIPLFLPISLPLIGSFLRALKWLKGTRNLKEKED